MIPRIITTTGRVTGKPSPDSRGRATETVEFSVTDAAAECVPFVRRKLQSRLFRVPAVANADAAAP